MLPALLAAVLVALGHVAGWTGVDTAAQVYRVNSFRSGGFSLWDSRWYGGHWTLDYSFLYPPLASVLGIMALAVLSAATAALAFDRLVRPHLGAGATAASYLFAAGTLVSASIGQLTSLTGEAFGLAALWAASRRRYIPACLLALAATTTSPLAGAFLALAGIAWAVHTAWNRDPRWAVGAALAAVAGVPMMAAAVAFPGDGAMPYPSTDWIWEMAVAAAIGLLAGRRHRAIALGAGLFMLAATMSELVPSALGGNVGRLEDMVALPLAAGLAWTRLPLLLPVAAVPLALSQWSPAWGALTSASAQPSTHRAFYTTLDGVLRNDGATGPAGRVEVVPTEYHWESTYVTSVMPLARGWERQLDEADNPIFYRPGLLDPSAYRAWLVDNGVRFVALADAPLDMAGKAEGALVASGSVPGLTLVWRSAQWRLYAVGDAPGIVSGPAHLVTSDGSGLTLDAYGSGPVTVRVRWNADWYVPDGQGCVAKEGSWLKVVVQKPGPVTVALSPLHPDRSACPLPPS